jgi:hypothetical protein
MVRLLWSPPMLLTMVTAWWIGFGQGGFFLLIAGLLERFLYAQRLGGSAQNGGEDAPLGSLYFLAACALSSMLFWALFPWSLLPAEWLPESGLPLAESPFTVNWLEYFGVNTAPLDNPLDIPVD